MKTAIILAIIIGIPISAGVAFWFIVLAIAKNLDIAPLARKDPLRKKDEPYV